VFEIHKEEADSHCRCLLVNNKTGDCLAFLPTIGGAIDELILYKDGVRNPLIEKSKDPQAATNRVRDVYFGAKLFPFANRVKGGKYFFEGQEFSLKLHPFMPHAHHGFVWNKEFQIVEEVCDENHACCTIKYRYQGEEEGFPFHFEIYIKYLLNSSSEVEFHTIVKNIGERKMPFVDGWHPYFSPEGQLDEWVLKLPSSMIYCTSEDGIPSGRQELERKLVTGAPIKELHLDNSFGPLVNEGRAETWLFHPESKKRICIWQKTGKNEGYNFVHVYTPQDRKSLAVEPMSGLVDAFNNELGRMTLAPGESKTFSFGVHI